MKQFCRLIMLIISIIGFSCQPMVKETVWDFSSPDNNINLRIELTEGQLQYAVESNGALVLNESSLGAVRADADLSRDLVFTGRSESVSMDENIKFLTGKQLDVEVKGTYQWLDFENLQGNVLRLEIKMFNDGPAMRYVFPEESGQTVTMVDDLMTFAIPDGSRCWLQPYDRVTQWTPAYERYYINGQPTGQIGEFGNGWCFPALFKTGDQWLHFGDGVAGYRSLGAIEKGFLGEVPVTWDQTKLISGIPGKDLVLARRKGEDWYIAGINGEDLSKSWTIDLSAFMGEFLVTRITDGDKPDQLVSSSQEESGVIDIEVLPYGGFAMKLTPVSSLASLK